MHLRALFLGDGPSDFPLAGHVEIASSRVGLNLDIATPDPRRLDPLPGHTVKGRLEALIRVDDAFELVIIHRDAEREDAAARREEIEDAVSAVTPGIPCIPVIPVRMTEAWLLTDEDAIRRIAGRPSGAEPLGLPAPAAVESDPDPKQTLQKALVTAANIQGRRLQRFKREFPVQRARLLEALDHSGPVSTLNSWRSMMDDVGRIAGELAS